MSLKKNSNSHSNHNTLLRKKILQWYDKNGRKLLPWKTNDIYKIWISEVMLQQTQVKTVIPFYKKFIKRYPTLKSLSNATLDDIFNLWSGLGFYRRAENIYKTSQIIKNSFMNKFPTNYDDVIKLPGIGRTTASAILTFSDNDNLPILDGNIKRLLSRIYMIDTSNYSSQTEKDLWLYSEKMLPDVRAADFIQGLMDIGNLICIKNKPNCEICPLTGSCQSYKNNRYLDLSFKKTVKKAFEEVWVLAILDNNQRIFLERIIFKNLWRGLYSSPIFTSKNNMREWLSNYNLLGDLKKDKWDFLHKLSHKDFLFHIQLCHIKSNKKISLMGDNWYNLSNIGQGMPKFQEKIINGL